MMAGAIHGSLRCVDFFFSSRRRHTRWNCDWSSDVCSSDLGAVRETIALEFADEESVVQTRFATSALALLRAHVGESLDGAAADAETALAAPLPVAPAGVAQWVFLGRGWTVGLAAEAALKLREAAQAWTEHYPALEYRH